MLAKKFIFPNEATKPIEINKRLALRDQNKAKLIHVLVVYQEIG